MQDFEKLGTFYLGREYDLAAARQGRSAPVRLQGPRHPRRLRRHDRQRQDRPVHRAARRGGHRRHPGHRHRPQGRPRQPAADLPRAARRGLPPWINEDEAARKGLSPGRVRRPTGGALEERAGRVGRGRRAHRPASARRPISPSTRRAATRACRCRSSRSFAPPPASRSSATTSCCATASRTTVTSLLGLLGIDADPAPEPRAHPARRPSSTGPGAAGRTRPAGSDPAGASAAGRAGRRARPGVVLPGQGPLRAGDGAEQPARLAGVRGLDGRRAARHRPPARTRPRASRASPSSPSPTSPTPSACSSSRCC